MLKLTRENERSSTSPKRPAALSLLSLSRAPSIAPSRPLTPAARRAHQRMHQPPRRAVDGAWFSTREFGVQPTLTAPAVDDSGSGQGQRRERSGSLRLRLRSSVFARCPSQARGDLRFSASSLVTFFWRSRRKLPARRGGLPARCTEPQRLQAKASPTLTARPKKETGPQPRLSPVIQPLTTPSTDHSPPSRSPACRRTPGQSRASCSSA